MSSQDLGERDKMDLLLVQNYLGPPETDPVSKRNSQVMLAHSFNPNMKEMETGRDMAGGERNPRAHCSLSTGRGKGTL